MNKRGISKVIFTIIMITLVLIAVGILWTIIQNILSQETEKISLDQFTIDVGIQSAKIEGSDIVVGVIRNIGKGNLTGIKFIFFDGKNSEAIERKVSLGELESQSFTFTLNELNVVDVEIVSIAPIYASSSGNEILGGITNIYNFKSEGSGSGNGGACTPDPNPCGGLVCGNIDNGCGTSVSCGTCDSGFLCTFGMCELEVSINSGIVDLTWPPGINLFFDSDNISKTESYTGKFAKFPGSVETRCLPVTDHIFPSDPEVYNKSFIRLGTPNNEKTLILSGDNYEIWDSPICGI